MFVASEQINGEGHFHRLQLLAGILMFIPTRVRVGRQKERLTCLVVERVTDSLSGEKNH